MSKFAVDAMGAFSGLKEEIETIVSIRVNKVIKRMNLVKKDEFDALKKMVQKLVIEKDNRKKSVKKRTSTKTKKVTRKPKLKRKSNK